MNCFGMVLDIQRHALNDGPGIRTTVFLKGCPLRCIWCHNPESWDIKPQLMLDRRLCKGCGACASRCEKKAHTVIERHMVQRELCIACGACVSACPYDALSLKGKQMNVDEVLSVVLRDKAYYTASDGGVTVSGGEPLMQFAFTLALLKASKAAGLHTCLDTSGFAPGEKLAEVLPFVDLFLFDYKATEEERHLELTGVPVKPILDNLDKLYHGGANILLRCPLIPSINDTDTHMKAIAMLEQKYPQLQGIHIMPYHNLGQEKASRLDIVTPCAKMGNTAEGTKARWMSLLGEAGCTRAEIQG